MISLHAAEINWEDVRDQPAPKFVSVKKSTAEEDAVDWELTSLIGQHAFGHISAGRSFGNTGHANVAGHANSEGSGADANAFMAAVAMHAITEAQGRGFDSN